MQKSMMKYITSIGQNTGTLKTSKNVQTMAMTMPFVAECLQREVTLVRTIWWQISMSGALGTEPIVLHLGDEGQRQQGWNAAWDAQRQEKFTGLTRTWILATFWWKGGTPHSAWWEGLDPHLQERWSNTGTPSSLFTLLTSNCTSIAQVNHTCDPLPSSADLPSSSSEGSTFGDRKAINRLRW